MTAIQPPAFMQNLTNHTAETDRTMTSAMLAGTVGSSTALKARGGVHTAQGSQFDVDQNGTPNMSVNVFSGVAFIPGTEGTKQGVYTVVNDATVNLALAASDPAQPRIDLIVIRVRDQVYSGANNDWLIDKVTGVASSSPAVPTAPVNSLVLAQVLVGANVTTIVTGNITDKRIYAAALGGVMRCTSTTRPTTAEVNVGQVIYESDTDLIKYLVDLTPTWTQMIPYRKASTLGAPAASVVFSGIPTTLKRLKITYVVRGDASNDGIMRLRINADTGANYKWQTYNAFTTGTANTSAVTQTSVSVGANPAGAGAGDWGIGVIEIPGWDAPHATYLTLIAQGGYITNTTGGSNSQYLNGAYSGSSAGGYSSVTLFCAAGNFQAGSQFLLEGWD